MARFVLLVVTAFTVLSLIEAGGCIEYASRHPHMPSPGTRAVWCSDPTQPYNSALRVNVSHALPRQLNHVNTIQMVMGSNNKVLFHGPLTPYSALSIPVITDKDTSVQLLIKGKKLFATLYPI
jgi:hypothetical protein